MWMCDRCQSINDDERDTCPSCHAPRQARSRPPAPAGTTPASPFAAPTAGEAPLAEPPSTTAPSAAAPSALADRAPFSQAPAPSTRAATGPALGLGLVVGWLVLRLLSPARLLFIAIGIGLLCFGRFLGYGNQEFRSHALTAQGIVARLDTELSDHKTMYYPVVRFTTARMQQMEVRSTEGSSPPSYHVGDQVKVYYDPQTPQDARVDSFFFAYGSLLVQAFGWLVILVAVAGTAVRTGAGTN